MTELVDGPVPRESLDRCALRAGLRGDPMLGTAFPASRVLLVEQPGPWGAQGLATSAFGAETARRLEQRAGRAGVRVVAIRRPGRTPRDQPRSWALVDTREDRWRQWWGSYTEPEQLLTTAFDRGTPREDALFLVCTNGRHDVCCALRGRPTAQAIAQHAPGRTWECTHLGGDRFAANVLVLSTGLLYGRVLPLAAADLVSATDRDEVLYELLRGRIGLPPAAQAALAFGYADLGTRRIDALTVGRTEPAGDGLTRVRLDVHPDRPGAPHAPAALEVLVRAEPVRVHGALSCHGIGDASFVRHRPVSVQPVT